MSANALEPRTPTPDEEAPGERVVRSVEAKARPKDRGSPAQSPRRCFSLRIRLGQPLGEDEDDDEL